MLRSGPGDPAGTGIEARLARELPALTITDQAVNLWAVKLGGHVLDFEGRHIRHVPVGPWPEAEAARAEAAMLGRLRPAAGAGPSLGCGP